jgi:hypothetical protein
VVYITDPSNKKIHIILNGKRRMDMVRNVIDEEEYDHFDEIVLFSTGFESVLVDDNKDKNYLYTDHEEGVWVK